MRQLLVLMVSILVACGGDVPHLIVRATGEDLGPLIDHARLRTYHPPTGGVVQWYLHRGLSFVEPGCAGDAYVVHVPDAIPVDAWPHPHFGGLYRARGAIVSFSTRSYGFLWHTGEWICLDDEPGRGSGQLVEPLGLPGRVYLPAEVAVELR